MVDVLVHRLREKVDRGFDAEADPHRARDGLCPQERLTGCGTPSACGWPSGTPALFAAGAVVLVGLTYLLLARSLTDRDHEIIRSTLVRYAAQYEQGGLNALNGAIRTDALAGRHEPLFVRVLGPNEEAIFYSMPANWLDFDPASLPAPPPDAASSWTTVSARRGATQLEIDSARLPDGTLFQVGKSTESRDENPPALPERPRHRAPRHAGDRPDRRRAPHAIGADAHPPAHRRRPIDHRHGPVARARAGGNDR